MYRAGTGNDVFRFNKMQSETADFATGAATWRTRRNIRVVIDSGLLNPLYENMTSSTTPEVHNGEEKAAVTGSMYKKFL